MPTTNQKSAKRGKKTRIRESATSSSESNSESEEMYDEDSSLIDEAKGAPDACVPASARVRPRGTISASACGKCRGKHHTSARSARKSSLVPCCALLLC